jgi:hypothetical protein
VLTMMRALVSGCGMQQLLLGSSNAEKVEYLLEVIKSRIFEK